MESVFVLDTLAPPAMAIDPPASAPLPALITTEPAIASLLLPATICTAAAGVKDMVSVD